MPDPVQFNAHSKAPHLASLLAGGLLTVALATGFATHITARAADGERPGVVPPAREGMVIFPGVRLGPDGKLHDAYTPTDLTALAGQKVIVTVYNYDTGPHSFTAPSLHLNVLIPAARRTGVPAIKVFSFTAHTAGIYRWRCMQPCDDAAKGWAIRHPGYMAGTITIERA